MCIMKMDSILTFLAGAALGAGLAILFAPHSGEETRRRIRERANKDYNSVKERINTAKQKIKDSLNETAEAEL